MVLRKISLKLCVYFMLICALLLIFGLNLRKYDIWNNRCLRSSMQEQDGDIEADERLLKECSGRPWFLRNGKDYPLPTKGQLLHKWNEIKLLPYQDPQTDRIVNQLMYVPHNYEKIKARGQLKTILLPNGLLRWSVKRGRDVFLKDKCPVNTCEITDNITLASTADMILYKNLFVSTAKESAMRTISNKNSKQISMVYYLESPYNTNVLKVPNAINWTATYRRDSTIVAPYSKWVYYDDNVQQKEQDRNYAAGKTKKVAWFVSNCDSNNGRLQYAHELKKNIEVDIYGACGMLKCSRDTPEICYKLLEQDYKFYLAFENSNCRDYITEKYFVNALARGVLPIVMGARPEDYEALAPRHSYIHVDMFASPKELADYLKVLDADDALYNSYFEWRGTGEFINTYFWCRVCAMLHNEEQLRKPYWYTDHKEWWRGSNVCINGSWRNNSELKLVKKDGIKPKLK